MRERLTTRAAAQAALCLTLVAAALASTAAQGPYRAPRTPDGQPDLQGIWQVLTPAEWDIQDHAARTGVPAGRGIVENNELPYQPWALAQKAKNAKAGAKADPAAQCFYPGTPRIMYVPQPFQIVQSPDYMAMLFEYGHHERLVYTNGVPHHEEIPFWMGDARGKWDGDTFVIESKNFTNDTWFDKAGNFHSDQMRLTERLTRLGPDHIDYQVTVDDSKVFTRPWKMRATLYRRVEPDAQILEYECFALSVFEGGRYDKLEQKAKRMRAAPRARPPANPPPAPPK